jgi:hypothetical protein
MTTTETPTEFETQTCSRCGGSGNYSYCQTYGTTCFKCRGKGRVYTKRGAAAKAYLLELRSKPGSAIKPGDRVWETIVTNGGAVGNAWYKVETIEPLTLENAGCWQIVDGVKTIPANALKVNLRYGKSYTLQTTFGLESKYLVKPDAATGEATMKQALEYQATLTKQGTPRKSK